MKKIAKIILLFLMIVIHILSFGQIAHEQAINKN
jgi:hypothetical protein